MLDQVDPLPMVYSAIDKACLMASLVLILGSIGIVGFQILTWFRYGEWVPVSNTLVWQRLGGALPDVTWRGIENILLWLFDCPASVTGLILGVGTGYLKNHCAFRALDTGAWQAVSTGAAGSKP